MASWANLFEDRKTRFMNCGGLFYISWFSFSAPFDTILRAAVTLAAGDNNLDFNRIRTL